MKIKVEFETKLTELTSKQEILAWLRYELGETNTLKTTNPLHKQSIKALRRSIKITKVTP